MPQTGEWLTPVDKDKVRSTVGQAKLDHMLAQTKSSMELQMKINAARAAAELANIKGKEKKDKEALAAKQKAKGSGESLTENLPDQQVDTKNPQAGMQGGGSDLSSILPPAGEAPPFLMDTQRQVTVGPEQINPVVRAPVRRETNRTNVSPNAMTAAQAQQGQQQRAYNMARLQQQAQQNMVANVVNIADVTGDLGTAAKAAGQFQRGDTEGAFNTLSKGGKTPANKLIDARIAASNSTYNKNQLTMTKTKKEILRIEGQLAALPLDLATKGANLMKIVGEIQKLDDEHAKTRDQPLSDRYGYPSSKGTNQLTDNEILIRTKELFGPPGGVLSSMRGKKLDPTMQANLDVLQVENFNRGNILTVSEGESKLTPTEQALSWMDSVFEYQSGRDDSEGAKAAHDSAVKNLVELGLSRGTVMDQDELKAGRVTPDLFLSPDDDNISNSTSSNLLFKHWITKRTGSEEVSESIKTLQQEVRSMIQGLMPSGAR